MVISIEVSEGFAAGRYNLPPSRVMTKMLLKKGLWGI